MEQKRPILIWRLKDAPEQPFRDSLNFWENEEAYQEWRDSKTGDEFVVMIPDGWMFDDQDAAYALGLNVTEEMRMLDFSGEPNTDCDLVCEVGYEGEEYTAYIIPSLTRRGSRPAPVLDADDLEN